MVKSKRPNRKATARELTFIDLAEAYLCTDCEALGNCAMQCPRCQSTALIAVTRAIPRHRDSIRIICVPPEPPPQMLEAA